MIACAPIVSDARMPVDNQSVDAELMQACGDRKASLSAANNDHGGIVVGVAACLGEAIAPVLGAEIAYAVSGLRCSVFQFFFVSLKFFKCCDDRPCAQPRRSIGNETNDACAGPEGGLEFEQAFDVVYSRAGDPARWRSACREMKTFRFCARKRLAHHRFDRWPAGHGLDSPCERQHIAPEALGQKQLRGGRRILRMQCRFEVLQPALRVRCCCCLLSFGDGHPQALVRSTHSDYSSWPGLSRG